MSAFNHILFSAGGLALAARSASIHCLHDGLVASAEPGTSDWFSGVAVAEGRLLPITDLGLYLNGGTSTGRVIEVARDLGIAGLRIDEVHGVSRNRPETIGPETSDAPVCEDSSHDGQWPVRNTAINDLGRRYRIVDIAHLVKSSRFLNVKCEPA